MAEFAAAVAGREHAVTVERHGERLRVSVDGTTHEVTLEGVLGTTHFRLWRDGTAVPVVIRRQGEDVLVGIADEQHRIRIAQRVPIARRGGRGSAGGAREVTAPMPGLVVAIEVAPGQTVEAGRAIAIIEAMKMQSEIRAPVAGRVTAVRVRAGQEVMGGAVLVTIEPL